ncbi:alpha-ketoglutarate-dependent dioxygenase alkB homolog 3 isoform X3 [Anas platyrhynchos]|uniref:alpha-ketoglutarate-dependent dioxygenase alkB homolog 3 isoform X3 n=1 Tax=Anas platyrhynchos TaxID=8839 RepID=UPI003AF30476
MADRRRRARVQGAWAGGAAGTAAAPKAPVASNVSPAGTTGQAWMQKGQLHPQKQFVFEKPSEVERKVPEAGVIDKPGVYELSTGPSGVSRIHLIPAFIDSEQADWMFEQLLQDIPWGQRTHIRQEMSFEEPRLTSWYGELPYTYSRITMQPNPNWHPLLTMLKERIEEFSGYAFNSLLCNLYRNEKDSVDWHSDDEPSLGKNPIIASLSFGATRTFEMRKKPSPGQLALLLLVSLTRPQELERLQELEQLQEPEL